MVRNDSSEVLLKWYKLQGDHELNKKTIGKSVVILNQTILPISEQQGCFLLISYVSTTKKKPTVSVFSPFLHGP